MDVEEEKGWWGWPYDHGPPGSAKGKKLVEEPTSCREKSIAKGYKYCWPLAPGKV